MGSVLRDLRELDGRASVALLLAAFVLITLQFRGSASYWMDTDFVLESEVVREATNPALEREFLAQKMWALTTVTLFAVLPFLVAVLGLRMRPREFGFSARGLVRHLWVYVAFFALMSPAIYLASKNPSFRETYPFPGILRLQPDRFWEWQLYYAAQFFALEMFFRGFLIFALERRFGLHGVLVMAIPYAMIHLHKPMPEAFGAIFAGLILGYMALRTRSFYGGVLLHYAVALSMDVLATST